MKKLSLILAGFFLTLFTYQAEARYVDYADIPTWADESIELVKDENIMTGFGDGTFQPKKNLNRAELLMLIFRTKDIDPQEVKNRNAESVFPDVPVGAWFEKAVIYATEQGWVKGFPDGNFYPGKEVNKAELATILQRVYELEPDEEKIPRFSDVSDENWFKEAVFSVYNNDLIRHARAYKFFPEKAVPRVEAAWIFAKILKMPRLMGTSKTNNFEQTGRLASSRRVAIRPKNLEVNKQGYDIEKQAVHLDVYEKNSEDTMIIGDDWLEVGNVVLRNTLDNRVNLDTISFRISFPNSVGPARSFELRMIDQYNDILEIEFPHTGTIFMPNWNKEIQSGEDYSFKVSIKPKDTTEFYPKSGIGKTYVTNIDATEMARFITEEGATTSRTNYRKAPIVYNSRNFGDIDFNPVVSE